MLLNIVKNLNKENFDVFIICPPDGEMIKKYELYATVSQNRNLNKKRRFDNFYLIYRFLKENNISIIHTNHFNPDYFGLLAAFFARVPVRISSIHGVNFFYMRKFGLKRAHYFFISYIYRFFYSFATHLVCVSNAVKNNLLTSSGIKVAENKLSVIHNSFDFNEDNYKENKEKTFNKQIAVIANFDLIKGHYEFIDHLPVFFKSLPDWKIILCGEGIEKKKCQKLVSKQGLNKSILFYENCHDVCKLIRESTFTVMPSWSEGLSMAILESMALTKPVIAYDVGGNSEIVNENNGILIPEYNIIQFMEKMIWLAKKPEKIASLGTNSFKIVEKKFNIKEKTKNFESLYLSQYNCLREKRR